MILNTWLLGAGVVMATWGSQKVERYHETQPHMGTKYIVLLYAPSPELARKALDAAFARIAQLDQVLSDYDPDSELSCLSRSAPHPKPVPISQDLFDVLWQAQKLSRASHGAFDATVGPLTKLWRRARRQRKRPDNQRLHDAKAAVGYQYLVLDRCHRTAQLTRPHMRLDLGGIAKGYAIDQALHTLREMGIDRALVNASGDMAATGPPPNKKGWAVAIAPLNPKDPPRDFGVLANQALATSGDAFQYVEIDGVRYSHIVDPRTGLGLTERSSVSVLANCCTLADGLASAASVLGPREGLKLIQATHDAAGLIVTKQEDQIATFQTDRFRLWLAHGKKPIRK